MSKKFRSYLDRLDFPKSLGTGLVSKYLSNIRLVMILIIGIILFGIFNFITIPRRLNPEVKIPIVTVVTTLPGASPEEVESLITIPLEQEISSSDGIDTLNSTSQESVSIITAQFVSKVSPNEARDEVQKYVDAVTNLPDEATTPLVNALDFENVPVWEFVVTSPSHSRASLERLVTDLEKQLKNIPSVGNVSINGLEDEEVQIIMSAEKMAEIGFQPAQLRSAISAVTKSSPAGTTTNARNSYGVAIDASTTSIESLRNLPITSSGQIYQLSDIAEIISRPAPQQKRTYYGEKNGALDPAVTIGVYKSSGADITEAEQDAKEIVDDFEKKYQGSLKITTLTSNAEDINTQFSELVGNFATTIGLVFLTLLFFLGLRQALLVSISIPLTFLVSFTVIGATGQTINFLTLFSLLLALGLLLDDAIVVIASTTEYYRSGKFSPREVGLLVWRDFIIPIWTTTLTTVWAFLPLLLASGIIGEFIKPIPVVVSSTLLASTAVAVLITLPLMVVLLELSVPRRVVILLKSILVITVLGFAISFLRTQPLAIAISMIGIILFILTYRWRTIIKKRALGEISHSKLKGLAIRTAKIFDEGVVNLDYLKDKYQNILRRILLSRSAKFQLISGVVIVSLFSYSLVPLGFVPGEFFPKSDSEIIYVGLELPTGTSATETELASLDLFEKLRKLPELNFGTIELGQALDTGGSSGGGAGSDNIARISLRIGEKNTRTRTSSQILDDFRNEFSGYTTGKLTFFAQSGGPPAGSDVTVKILGDELSELSQITNQVEEYLESQPGVVNISRSIKPSTSKLSFQPDLQSLAAQGLSTSDVGFWLRTSMGGLEVGKLPITADRDEEKKIILYASKRLLQPEELPSLNIVSQSGIYPISSLGSFVLKPSSAKITREERKRSVTITAGVSEGFSAPETNSKLFDYLDTLSLPKGYNFGTGGANQENEKSVQSILQAMLLSFVLILATMVVQLSSFRKAIIIMMVIPLAISGVFLLFALTGTPLSFPALIGVLALFGIVVNNSIVLVDKISQNSKVGMSMIDAIVDASGSRLQPIFFSSLTTIVGLVPITLSDPIWQGLGGAIISGLSISGITMLLFIPVVYSLWFEEEDNNLKAS
ncbi:efflux RND transporter permease subunit [Candidatus Parcubacteria bacterium]|nr:efflux RND transporter permease subunit [Candidatus Parcubacteria bacterium]